MALIIDIMKCHDNHNVINIMKYHDNHNVINNDDSKFLNLISFNKANYTVIDLTSDR